MTNLVTFEKPMSQNRTRLTELLSAVSAEKHPLCDVRLRIPVSDGSDAWTVIGSNSAFLRAISSVFEALWTSDSSKQDAVDTVDIADCSIAAVNAMNALAFGCFEQVEISQRNIGELLYAATKYDIKLLADACELWIEDIIANASRNPGFFVTTLCALQTVGLSAMADKMAQRIDATNVTPLFMCEESAHLPLAVFCDLLKSDELRLAEEYIWEQCVKWAQYQSEHRQEDAETEEVKLDDDAIVSAENSGDLVTALRPMKELIRFALMPTDFFIKRVSATGLLTDGEIVKVCHFAFGMSTDGLFCCSQPRNTKTKDQFLAVDMSCFSATETIRVKFDFTSFEGRPEPLVIDGIYPGWIGLIPARVHSRREADNDSESVSFFCISTLSGEQSLSPGPKGRFEIRAFTRDNDGTQIGTGIPISII